MQSNDNSNDNAKYEEAIIWRVMAGKPIEVSYKGRLFAINQDYPKNLDPVKVVNDFMRVINLTMSETLQKAVEGPEHIGTIESKEKGMKKKKTIETGTSVGKQNNITIYKEKVIGFYRTHSGRFTAKDMFEYFKKEYPDVSDGTATNKQRAYIQFMVDKGIVVQVEGHGNQGRVYKFDYAPYNTESIAKE